LLHWLLVANARGRYSRGSTETLLNEDLAIHVPRWHVAGLDGSSETPVWPPAYRSRAISPAVASTARFFTGVSGTQRCWCQRLVQRLGDLAHPPWASCTLSSGTTSSPNPCSRKSDYETGEINEIANMAFITGQTNRRISNKDAGAYLRRRGARSRVRLKHCESQCVPVNEALWSTDRYRDFLAERRRALADRMNAFIREKSGT
jgi:hypothetical protein